MLITSPVVGAPAVERLVALAAKAPTLMAACDHPDAVAAIGAAAKAAGASLTLLVDVDPGLRRTGVADAPAALALARQIDAHPQLTFGGVQFYCGAEQHIEDYAARREAIVGKMQRLAAAIEALQAAGLAPPHRQRRRHRQPRHRRRARRLHRAAGRQLRLHGSPVQ